MEESLTKAPKSPVLDISSPLVESELIQPPSMPEPTVNTPLPPKPLGMGLGIGQGVNSGLGVMEYNDTFDYLNKPVPVRPIGMGPGIGQPITFGQ